MSFDLEKLPGTVDVTAVAQNATVADIRFTMDLATAYSCSTAIVNASYLTQLIAFRSNASNVKCGSTAAFPYGCELTSTKLYTCQQVSLLGAQEIDIVMNVGEFLSGNIELVERELRLLADTVSIPIKVIIETALLSDEQIVEASRLAADCGFRFVKTSTGLYNKTVTPSQVRMMKEAVGDKAEIKASGGIRTLEQAEAFLEAGAARLGIGSRSAYEIFKVLDQKLDRKTPEL